MKILPSPLKDIIKPKSLMSTEFSKSTAKITNAKVLDASLDTNDSEDTNDSDSSIVIISATDTPNSPEEIVRESQEFGDSLNINLLVEMDFTDGPDWCNVFNPQTSQFEDVPGWKLQADLSIHKLTIRLDFTIDANGIENIICTTNPMEIDTSMQIEFPKIDNIEVKGGKVTSEFFEDVTNSIKLFSLI